MLYKINEIKLNIDHNEKDLRDKIKSFLKCKEELIDWDSLKILRKSIDARDKLSIKYIYNISIDILKQIRENINVIKYNEIIFNPKINNVNINNINPIIVGFGPAGLFAAYIFVINGIEPIIIERGKRLEERIIDVNKFFEDIKNLDENSNVCFGEGGAGAFSDGKLNTGNKDKNGIYKFILETFVKYGANENILYDNLPHIGTDKLTNVIINMRKDILKMGAKIKYNTKFTYNDYKNYAKEGIPIILAIGNSSRDTFRDLIKNGFQLKPKAIAVGFRVAHKQSIINEAQYGNKKSFLPPATYKLIYDTKNGHSVYSFCMCPGGYIINSSNFRGYLSINGMSYSNRNGKFANSAIVETLTTEDVKESFKITNDVTAIQMIEFQEMIEKKAYDIEKGCIPYFSKNIKGEEKDIFKGLFKYNEKILDVYENIGLRFNIKEDIKNAIEYFSKIIKGYNDNYIIAGVETRTSSPVSLDRDENFMCNIKNFYPCGEGLGHGGGILSAASDGVKVALYIVKNLEK